jgi:hypothetical protein
MLPEQSQMRSSVWSRVAGGAFVVLAVATYYVLFYFPPRLLGSTDPDRYYHLGLSRLISHQGLLRTLPQVEDLGWGRYFPDKEFLFHVLTGSADWINGSMGVLLVVPLLGIGIAACLYAELSRVVRPLWAALFAAAVPLLTVRFLFRLTLLRPHMLAVLFFCLLLLAILRKRPKLVALAAAGFALSYHAFYIVVLVAGVAWLFRRRLGPVGGNCWLWSLAGLAVGIVLNPYFPSNLVMSWLHLQLALGINPPPGADIPMEMASRGWKGFLLVYGFVPASLIAAALAMKFRRVNNHPETAGFETTGFWFLFVLTLLLTVLAFKSDRAMEYGVPAGILMVGYCARVTGIKWWIPFNLALLLACHGYVARVFYLEYWSTPPKANFDLYAEAISTLPADAAGKKVFNCEWWSGAYLLHERPDLRFVDMLDPAFLWRASPQKYLARLGLIKGAFHDPHAILRGAFKADYVLCASPALIRQMDSDAVHFRSLPGSDSNPVRVFSVQPD